MAFELNNVDNLESSFADTDTSQNNLDNPHNFDSKLESEFENISLRSPTAPKDPIYAEVNKLKKTSNQVTFATQLISSIV